jgi:copper homeostasis protein
MVALEVVCCSPDDAEKASALGVDRVELCAAIAEGGLTPSLGMTVMARERCKAPLVAMVRPRESGFLYSETEIATMECDIDGLLEAGADGVVFGVLKEDGRIDDVKCGRLLARTDTRETVFHRAFDLTPDAFEALDTLIDLGFTRVLTSGQKPTATEGADCIKQLIDRAAGRIEVLACGTIRPHNVRSVVQSTGCSQVHMGAFREQRDPSGDANKAIHFGQGEGGDAFLTLDEQAVREVMSELSRP